MTDDGDNIIHFNPWRDFNNAPTVGAHRWRQNRAGFNDQPDR